MITVLSMINITISITFISCTGTIVFGLVNNTYLHSEAFLKTYKGAQQTPQQKYDLPVTEAQEIGWESTPLVITILALTHTFRLPLYIEISYTSISTPMHYTILMS